MLEKRDLEAIGSRWRRYERLRKRVPGHPIDKETFVLADATRVINKERPGQKVPVFDLMDDLEDHFEDVSFDRGCYAVPSPSYSKALKFARGQVYRDATMPPLSGRFLSGAFRRAVGLVLAGRASRRDLLRVFRLPGKKNCSVQDLTAYQSTIDKMGTEIAGTIPKAPDKYLDSKYNNLIPTEGKSI